MSNLFLRILSAPLARWSTWLAITQQKEYRWDRWWIYIKSDQGRAKFRELLPTQEGLTRTGFKRPVRTPRLYVLAALSLALIIWLAWPTQSLLVTIFRAVIMYLALPFIILSAAVPTMLLGWLVTKITVWRAARKVHQTNPTIIGITGSYGKTSTKLLLGEVLKQKYQVFVTPKSYNTNYSVAKAVLEHYQGEEILVVEYGAYVPGEIAAIASWLKPSMAILTGFAPQHLGLFGSEANIIKAKAELVQALPQNAPVIINDAVTETFDIARQGGASEDQFLVASSISLQKISLNNQAQLNFQLFKKKVQTKLVGLHYQEIVQLVVLAAQNQKLTTPQILKGLESFEPGERSITTLEGVKNCLVLNDGVTSNPKGFAAVLDLSEKFTHTTKVLITGGIVDLGDQEVSQHQFLADKARSVGIDKLFHLGMAGGDQFKKVFKKQYIELSTQTQPEWQNFLSSLSKETLVIIEGRVPDWIMKDLRT